jgi:hypothetical protein
MAASMTQDPLAAVMDNQESDNANESNNVVREDCEEEVSSMKNSNLYQKPEDTSRERTQ